MMLIMMIYVSLSHVMRLITLIFFIFIKVNLTLKIMKLVVLKDTKRINSKLMNKIGFFFFLLAK